MIFLFFFCSNMTQIAHRRYYFSRTFTVTVTIKFHIITISVNYDVFCRHDVILIIIYTPYNNNKKKKRRNEKLFTINDVPTRRRW